MNTFSAWPAPARNADAVVVLRHTEVEEDSAGKHRQEDVPEGAEDVVPLEVRNLNAKGRHLVRYWRFLGFKGDGKVGDWLRENAPDMLKTPSPTGGTSTPVTRPMITHQASLGVHARSESPAPMAGYATPDLPDKLESPTSSKKKSSSSFGFGALKSALSAAGSGTTSPKLTAADVRTAFSFLVCSFTS